MENTKHFKFKVILTSLLVSVITFSGGYYLGKAGYLIELKKNPPEIKVINQRPNNGEVDFSLFWTVWDEVQLKYLERPVDGQQMLYGAIEGMVESLGDPYTSFLPPNVNEELTNAINGQYEGIGAELDIRDNQLLVVAPLDGSPAIAAGLRTGDKILKIDEDSTFGLSLSEAVLKIRGQSGSVVNLTIQRDSDEPFVLAITRGKITIKSVQWEDKGDGTAYIRVSTFGEDTAKDWSASVAEINSQMAELDAIVLDLRGNPGGYVQAAVFLAEEFYRGEPVLYYEDAEGDQTTYDAKRVGAFANIPRVVVLIDEGSASSSEILAAALRDNANAILIGMKSFGKGTIQDVENFDDGSGIHITVGKWLTPAKEWVHEIGLTPEIEVDRGEDPEIDLQLEKALETANQI